jgi:hypothetical protein
MNGKSVSPREPTLGPEAFQQMQADRAREKAAMNRTWAKRKKQIDTIVSSTARFTRELQALYAPSPPQLPQFQLPDATLVTYTQTHEHARYASG